MKPPFSLLPPHRPLVELLPKIHRHLQHIPTIRNIGIGAKEVGGELTRELAFRVHVRVKLPLESVPLAWRIPTRIEGVATDVVVSRGRSRPCSSTPNVYPGRKITRAATGSTLSVGTIGLVVKQPQGAQEMRAILTCEHVIKPASKLLADMDLYVGEKNTCNDPVADTLLDPEHALNCLVKFEGRFFSVDAGLARLKPKVKSTNKLSTISNLKPQLRDILTTFSAADLQLPTSIDPSTAGLNIARAKVKPINEIVKLAKIGAHKHGAITEFTSGTITGICVVGDRPMDLRDAPNATETSVLAEPRFVFEMWIEPDPAHSREYDETYAFEISLKDEILHFYDDQMFPSKVTATVVKQDSKTFTLHLKGRVFSLKGDSGSAVVDNDGRIVGLLGAGGMRGFNVYGTGETVFLPTGYGVVQFIRPTFAALNLQESSIVPAGDPQRGESIDIQTVERLERTRTEEILDNLSEAIGHTPDGERLAALARSHLQELQRLIHHRRRVTVVWHRSKGPAFLASFLRGTKDVEYLLPKQIEGVTIGQSLQGLRTALLAEGSDPLKEALNNNGDWLSDLLQRANSVAHLFRLLAPDGLGPVEVQPFLAIVNARGVPGTAGAVVRGKDGVLQLLCNWHVLYGGGADTGEKIFAVDERNSRMQLTHIGDTAAGRIGRIMYGGVPVFIDCAIGTLAPRHTLPGWIQEKLQILSRCPGQAHPYPGQRVSKDGAATDRTYGRVVDIAYPDLPTIEGRRYDAPGQLLIQATGAAGVPSETEVNFSAGGDSGAAVVDDQHSLVGLLWGSNASGDGIATPIGAVLEALDVELVMDYAKLELLSEVSDG
jgi:hypothetical protein